MTRVLICCCIIFLCISPNIQAAAKPKVQPLGVAYVYLSIKGVKFFCKESVYRQAITFECIHPFKTPKATKPKPKKAGGLAA